MDGSILDHVKKMLGIDPSFTNFDIELVIFINTAFARLNELGVGTETTFYISDNSATWEDFLQGATEFNEIQAYIYLRVRLLFDPPTMGHHVTALDQQIQQFEWRLNVASERTTWVNPTLALET